MPSPNHYIAIDCLCHPFEAARLPPDAVELRSTGVLVRGLEANIKIERRGRSRWSESTFALLNAGLYVGLAFVLVATFGMAWLIVPFAVNATLLWAPLLLCRIGDPGREHSP
jgi:hypothetical protein